MLQLVRTEAATNEQLDRMIVAIQKRLEVQGHNNTYALTSSIEKAVISRAPIYEAGIKLLDYWEDVDKGQTARQIAAKGAVAHRRDLERYFLQRGIPYPINRSVAFRTLKIHMQTGSPTDGSYRYSKNGKRTGFFSDVIDESIEALELAIEGAIIEDIDQAFISSIENILELV